MPRLSPANAILALTFIESLATVLLERGVYFYTHDVLGMSEQDNLWLAAGFGAAYVVGALVSHAVAVRLGERRLLFASLLVLLAVHVGLALRPDAGMLMVCFPIIGLLQGIKWPVVESFVSAGRLPSDLAATLSRFNVTWAISVPVALAGSGPLIESGFPASFFVAAAICNVLAIALSFTQPEVPQHLDVDHPARPAQAELGRLAGFLSASRWSMLLSYALLFLLAPLLPELLERLSLDVSRATQAAAVLDVARVIAFFALGRWLGWRGKTWPLVSAIALLPTAFLLILFGNDVGTLLLGEVLFGLSSGLLYTGALYYALLLKNAAVEAGGAHEGLIGVGFALGPLIGLLSRTLEPVAGGRVGAVLLSLGPVCLALTGLALRKLVGHLR